VGVLFDVFQAKSNPPKIRCGHCANSFKSEGISSH
jgi:hypothetical protein